MSPICQTFVQNAWRKDLCSNCFKSKEEHGASDSCVQPSRREYSSDGPLVRRYLGVTGRSIYSRNYYGNSGNAWNSPTLESRDAGALKSPGLINRMDSIIKQENEKNSSLSSLNLDEDNEIHKNCFSSSCLDEKPSKEPGWILSDIIGGSKKFELSGEKGLKDRDCSSDLGSDASHDTSVSSSDNSACSDIASSGRSSSELKEIDSDSVKSYPEEDQVDSAPALSSILKTSKIETFQKVRLKISFNENDQVIGYGGDVDYSDDDEDDYDYDDDEDALSVCSLEMPLDERELKYVTERNTNFNSEMENFENKSKEQPVPRKESPHLGNTSPKEDQIPKQEGKVKLKRCPPLVTTKPQMKATPATLPSEARTTETICEDIPMKGIKPKYVSREEEMIERCEDEFHDAQDKVTSIDDALPKVTSIDEYLNANASFDKSQDVQTPSDEPKITNFSDDVLGSVSTNQSKAEDDPVVTSFGIILSSSSKSGECPKKDQQPVEEEAPNGKASINFKDPSLHKTSPSSALPTKSNEEPDSNNDERSPEANGYSNEEAKVKDNSKEKESSSSLSKSLSDDNVDYTVRSAHPLIKKCHSESVASKNQLEGDSDRVHSGVLPMNVITIQRRNSFMESQLGGPIYSANEMKPAKTPYIKHVENKRTDIGSDSHQKTKKDSDIHDAENSQNSRIMPQKDSHSSDNLSAVVDKTLKTTSSPQNKDSSSDVIKTPDGKDSTNKSIQPTNSTSTFGTPLTNLPQPSFLHTGGIRAIQNSKSSHPSSTMEVMLGFPPKPMMAPEPTQTASIQKSAIYSSSSILRGLPAATNKPATTPKPNFLKDKPKLPSKPSPDCYSSHVSTLPKREKIYATPTHSLAKPEHRSNLRPNTGKDLDSEMASLSLSDRTPEDPKGNPRENVYDVPVTSPPSNATSSPVSSSSGYSTTSQTSLTSTSQELDPSPAEAKQEASAEAKAEVSHYRATFEANRSLLSSALNLGSNTLNSKRPAPQPPQEEEHQQAVAGAEQDQEGVCEEEEEAPQLETPSAPTQEKVPAPQASSSPSYENLDMESYSSFTDDFEDDDEPTAPTEEGSDVFVPLRRAERSSSATPLNRNSVGPVSFGPPSSMDETACAFEPALHGYGGSKLPAVRSHSVPRSVESAVFPAAKAKQESKFSFVKNGFFRPSSPPSIKRKSSSERGRDRSKRLHSGFSLKKLLRLGSSDKSLKAAKLLKGMKDQEWDRETRKLKLQIIHPLDYNPNGVEVIARPEKTSPIYDYTGIYANTNLPEASLQSQSESTKNLFLQACDSRSTDSPSPAPSSTVSSSNQSCSDGGSAGVLPFAKKSRKDPFSKLQKDASRGIGHAGADKKVEKKNSFLKKRRKTERKESLTFGRAQTTYVKPDKMAASLENLTSENFHSEVVTSASAFPLTGAPNPAAAATARSPLAATEHIPPATEAQCIPIYPNRSLGFNSEGRPKPPPPPRKTSLESSPHDGGSSGSARSSDAGEIPPSTRPLSTSELPPTGSGRPHRPPPPRRTPSNAGSADPPAEGSARQISQHARSTLYANLGEARVPITPRKPGRSCSVKDEEKEKRKAPNPPHSSSQVALQAMHNQQQQFGRVRNLPETASTGVHLRSTKGPAPPAPNDPHLLHILNHEYEYIDDSPLKNADKAPHSTSSSSSPFSEDKTSGQSATTEPSERNSSLEDQYGAVVFANLEALSNLLDQVCNQPESNGYKPISDKVSTWSDVHLPPSSDPVSCGSRLFYQARAGDFDVTAMVTQEVKVASDPLLMPRPIVTFRDDLPSRILLRTKSHDRNSVTPGTVWLLPRLTLHSLAEFGHSSQRLLEQHPKQWERHACLFLLQLVTALKQLQAKGIEETSLDLVLVSFRSDEGPGAPKGEQHLYPRLILGSSTQSSSFSSAVSLCHCAAAATQLLLGHANPLEAGMRGPVLPPPFTPSPHLFSALVTALREERSTSLTRAKCLLEATLFGPSNVRPSDSNLEASLQKWLDLERAKVLHSLVSEQGSGTSASRSIWTKFHLFFLVRTSVKALKEALLSVHVPDVTNF